MTYDEFINRVVDEGIESAKSDYVEPKDKNRLEGSIAGFEACRNKKPIELIEVYKEAQEYANKSFREHDDAEKYWWFRCYQLEVEWVCNVVSAILFNEGHKPLFPHLPTCNGMTKAASILGVSKSI